MLDMIIKSNKKVFKVYQKLIILKFKDFFSVS